MWKIKSKIKNVIFFLKDVFDYVAGGNQRELARAKNLKKTVKKAAAEQDSNKGLSLEARKAR